jgi:hypothetical protein
MDVQEDRWQNANEAPARCWSRRLYIVASTALRLSRPGPEVHMGGHGILYSAFWLAKLDNWANGVQTTGVPHSLSRGEPSPNPDKVHLIQVTPRGWAGATTGSPGRQTMSS